MWCTVARLRSISSHYSLGKSFRSTQKSVNLLQCNIKRIHCHSLVKTLNVTLKLPTHTALNKYQHTKGDELQNVVSEQDCNSFTYRTHTCGELRAKDEGKTVTLCGWVQFLRLSKFLLLRDAYGTTQCIIDNEKVKLDVSLETVVEVEGTVALRPQNMVNANMSTGEIEIVLHKLKVLNTVDKLPFNIRDYQKAKEQLRLQHRYIDLRFPQMQHNLRLRSKMLHKMRKFLVEKHAFVEVETPTLFCRTPGGAREFVVPTHYPELFYSLVQSPQQFKQMLMSGGIDRYFQVARCYRDETTRPDRQPEFTQLDIELSFTNRNGVINLIEELLCKTFTKDLPKPPFKRMKYRDALELYGSDKPNLTYGIQLQNIKHLFPKSVDDPKFHPYLIPIPKALGKTPDPIFIKSVSLAKEYFAKIVLPEQVIKTFGSYFSEKLIDILGEENSCIIAIGNTSEEACLALGEIRELTASILSMKGLLTYNHVLEPLWVVDFPLFNKGAMGGLESCHHPFTAPHPEDVHLVDTDPLKVRSLAYDFVLNGNEIGGGSVRVHDVNLQEKLLRILNIDAGPLSHFLNALKNGCPPHAGIALGIDRLLSIACDAESIRDVIAFPKNHEGKDPLSGAPNAISEEDKKYYYIKTIK